MMSKRGRPISNESQDPAVLQQLQRRRERNQRYYATHRSQRQHAPTQAQLQQGEMIIEFGFDGLSAAEATTQLPLGLRVRGLTLPQDTENARLQQGAVPVDEHTALYNDNGLSTARTGPSNIDPIIDDPRANKPSPNPTSGQPSQPQLTHFFRTRPSGNPFPTPTARLTTPLPIRHSPARPSFSPLSPQILQSIGRGGGGGGGSEDLIFADNDFSGDEEEEVEEEEEQDEWQEITNLSSDDSESNHDDSIEARLYDAPDNDNNRGPETPRTDQDEFAAHNIDDREDSVYDFASERSVRSSDEDDEVAITDLQHTVAKLFDFFQGDVGGCTEEQHDERRRRHMAEVADDDHHGLSDIFNDPNFISVLASPEMLTPDRLARYEAPTPVQFESIFCGTSPHRLRPQHVCLHREETQAQHIQQASDVDSYLGFLDSPAACRGGLWHQPAPQSRQNMTTDVHLQTSVFDVGQDQERAPRATLAMLRDVPHFLLGRVANAHDITIYVLFPHLPHPRDKFVSLTREQHSRWLDQIFYPAVYRHYEAHYTQHLPASFRHAYDNSKARQVEGRKIETSSYQAQQAIGYHLQQEQLERLWADVLSTIDDTPGLADFREPQLFFSAKGCKLQFKTGPSRPTLLDAMEYFESYLEGIFHREFVDWGRTFIDLAFEICPGVSHLITQPLHVDEEAQVLGWKRCCLERIIRRLYDNEAPAMNSKGQRYYTQHMLQEMTCVTSAPPKRSRLYQAGVRYFQLYSSAKEVYDAAKSIPFDNDGLEEMALDPQIRQAAHHLAGGHRREVQIVERAYCASKRRTHEALRDSRHKSFGIRAEFRISWALFQGLAERLRFELREQLEVIHVDCPSYAWAIKTEVYLGFLWRSVDKYASLFEIVRARCRSDLVTWEQTKMMAMALRCLRYVLGGHQLARESALWWSRREREVGQPRQVRRWYGLGFCNTLPRYGYCWLEPRIDWERLIFQSAITDEVLFGNQVLREQYLRRGGQIQDFFGATRQLELALDWMDRYHANERIRDRLLFWMVYICLRQFRVDIIRSVQCNVDEEQLEEAVKGTQGFCLEYLEEIMAEPIHLISGNRCDFKQPTHLGHFLFDYEDGRTRKHWEDRPFRKLYRRARTALRTRHTGAFYPAFARRFWRCLYAYHWILPYPCAEVFTQTTKQGMRMWYSIDVVAGGPGDVERCQPEDWQWVRKEWRVERPPIVPEYSQWTKEEWMEWMERIERNRVGGERGDR